jgi:hypothetical protein
VEGSVAVLHHNAVTRDTRNAADTFKGPPTRDQYCSQSHRSQWGGSRRAVSLSAVRSR